MTTDTDVQKRIATILEKAARSGGASYEVQACVSAIDKLADEGLISAEHRELLLGLVTTLTGEWTPAAVAASCADLEARLAAGTASQVDVAQMGLLLVSLVGQRVISSEEAAALLGRLAAASLQIRTPADKPAPPADKPRRSSP